MTTKRSPSALSAEFYRSRGYYVDIVTRYVRPAGARFGFSVDLWNFADLLAFHPTDRQPWKIVQATSASNLSARRKKVYRSKEARALAWLGEHVELHAWRSVRDPARPRRRLWTPRIERLLPTNGGPLPFAFQEVIP